LLDETLIKRASELTGITDRSALIRLALETLIAREAANRLMALQGSEPALRAPRRRRVKF
jgi:hypothetical protein